jgi:Protein of unknown function (DUF742)
MTGANWWQDGRPRVPDPRMIELSQTLFEAETPGPRPPATDDPDYAIGPVVRPFIVTGGRTRPTDERLRVETLISALPAALSAPLGFERQRIVQICQRPVSVAEVANGLVVPIGVARVLIADLIAERLVTVHEQAGPDEGLSRSVLERILEGVRAL